MSTPVKRTPGFKYKDDPKPVVLTDLQTQVIGLYVDEGLTQSAIARRLEKQITSVNRIVNLPHVQQEILRRTGDKIAHNAVRASQVMGNLLGARSEKVRFEAAKDALDRGGFKPPDRNIHEVRGDISIKITL